MSGAQGPRVLTEDQRSTGISESEQKLGLGSGQGPAIEGLTGRWLAGTKAGEDSEADGGDTVWRRPQ